MQPRTIMLVAGARPNFMKEEGDKKESDKGDWLGTAVVWLSAVSALAYFLTSHGIKNHIFFLLDSLTKIAALR